MTYQEAINEVRAGKHLARTHWQGQYIFRRPENPAVPGEPGYLTLHTEQGDQDGWTPSESDTGLSDWITVS